MSKHGSVPLEILVVLVVIFIMIISAFASEKLLEDLNTDIQLDETLSNETKETVQTLQTNYHLLFDNVILFLFIFLWILAMVAAYFMDSNPLFLIFTIIMLAIVLVVAGFLSNTYDDLLLDETYAGLEVQYPITHFLMSNILIVILVVGFSVGVVLYGKQR